MIQPIIQVITDGTNAYLYGAARIAQSSAGSSQYFLTDALGSVNQLYDPAVSSNDGIVLEQTWIDSYGVANAPSGTASTPYGFTGEYTDPTGLTFLRARYYSSATARFISQDPFGGFKQAPQSLNPYIYSKNNPVVYTDPSGEFPPLWLLLMLGIAGVLQGCSPDTSMATLPAPEMPITPTPQMIFTDNVNDYDFVALGITEGVEWTRDFLGTKSYILNGVTFVEKDFGTASMHVEDSHTLRFSKDWNDNDELELHYDVNSARTKAIHELGHLVDMNAGNSIGYPHYSFNSWVPEWEVGEQVSERVPYPMYFIGNRNELPSNHMISPKTAMFPNYCPLSGKNACIQEDFAETFTWMVYDSKGLKLDKLDYWNDYNIPSEERQRFVIDAISQIK